MLKTVSSVINAIGALNYKGTWNASTNSPTLTSGVGTKGDYYVVSVAGSTNLDGETLWGVGDWAVFNGSTWQKVDGGDSGNFVNISVSALTGYMYANGTSNVTASTTIPVANVAGAVPNTVNVIAGGLITGGGALTGNVTLTLNNVPNANVTGLGTMATQNANAVAITGGTEGNVTYTNVTISSGNATLTNVTAGNVNVTFRGTSSNTGALNVGGNLSSSDIGIISSFVGNATTYAYIAVQNTNNSNTSYTSISTINDGFTAYSDLGTNSTTYSYSAAGFPNNAVSQPSATFLVGYSGNVAIASWNANAIHFLANANASTTSAMVINGNNSVTINTLGQTTSSTATFGTASLPLTPAGYLQFTLANSTVIKVPYYAS